MPQFDPTTLFLRFGLALLLGFLIGFEREREKETVFAGMRTFAFICLLGAIMAFMSEHIANVWLFIAGFVMVAAYGLTSYYRAYEAGHTGVTTEVAFLLSFLVGALVYWDLLLLAAAITVAIIAVLVFKPNLQRFAAKVKREDIYAGLEFAIVAVIALPILPDRTYDPLHVLNPKEIWIIVVLVSAINLGSYVLSQVYGAQRGISMAGILGGMVSSTAATFDFARRSKKTTHARFVNLYALAIAIASVGMFFRVVILILPFNPSLGTALIAPMAVGAVVMMTGVILLALKARQTPVVDDTQAASEHVVRSPFALKPALQFAILFAVVLWFTKAAQVYLGNTATYVSSSIGGIAGVDAVAISIAKLGNNSLPQDVAMRSVTLGAATNTLFKGVIATWLGTGAVRQHILPLFILSAAACIVAAFVV